MKRVVHSFSSPSLKKGSKEWKVFHIVNNNISSKSFKDNPYPMWYCPIFSCPFRTTYAKNVGIHLRSVHSWKRDAVREVLDNFFEAKEDGVDFICSKDENDPTNPSLEVVSYV